MDSDVNELSLVDSGGSNDDQGSKSFNTEFSSLHLHSSLDSNRSDKVSRGKPGLVKSNSANQTRPKSKSTSKYVLKAIGKDESTTLSGYFSTFPTSENEISNYVDISNMLSNNNIYNDNVNHSKRSSINAKKLVQDNIMCKMINKIKKYGVCQWIFDHGDTQLIKSCRCGQIQAVHDALKSLQDHQQTKLIDHQNMGNQTALSIATNSMNEILIELLLMNGASPDVPLSMGNNVLHIAAAMILDPERKTYFYLIKGISRYGKSDKLINAINAKNIFDYDPVQILMLYRNANETNAFIYNCMQHHIDESTSIRRFYERSFGM